MLFGVRTVYTSKRQERGGGVAPHHQRTTTAIDSWVEKHTRIHTHTQTQTHTWTITSTTAITCATAVALAYVTCLATRSTTRRSIHAAATDHTWSPGRMSSAPACAGRSLGASLGMSCPCCALRCFSAVSSTNSHQAEQGPLWRRSHSNRV